MEHPTWKKQQVRSMFNSIAPRYDFLNHFLSAGTDYLWRKKAIKLLENCHPKTILDIATGTGDLAIGAAKLNPEKIVGIDIADDMLEIGRRKILAKKLDRIISLEHGDSENLRFDDGSFDAAMVAFGVRNFENLEKGLKEMFRVLKENGMIVILEFSQPQMPVIRTIYQIYFKIMLPVVGRLVSGNRSAYQYLPDSVGKFPAGKEMLGILESTGFRQTVFAPLSFGIATLYSGFKIG
jgi:demethylmenaquinone methyltransferase/2-methoxy-6-polyprenyl-1,4-benzoquinol methylase